MGAYVTRCFLIDLVFVFLPISLWFYSLYSSSSWHAISTDIPDPLLSPLLIVNCFRQVIRATPRIHTELLYVYSSWSPCFARPCEGVHRSTSHMSSSLLLQQCPAYLVRLNLIFFVIGGLWPYSCYFLRGVASRICSIQLIAFLCNFRQAFSLFV